MTTRRITGLVLLGLSLTVWAVDGKREISQSMMPMTITQPGTYVVTENLAGQAGQHGIIIVASAVTLDLNGFALNGTAGSLSGIRVPTNQINVTIHNGTVRGWGGIGVDAPWTTNSLMRDLVIRDNGDDGLNSGFSSTVTHCRVLNNRALVDNDEDGKGIEAENSSTISHCIVRGNLERGIDVHSGSTVRNCVVSGNGHDGIHGSVGITVLNCTANGNDEGIEVDTGSAVVGCSVSWNVEDGIRDKGGSSTIVNCLASYNGANATNTNDGIDIHAGTLVVNCHSFSNTGHGIRVDDNDPSCSILKSICSNNGRDGIHVNPGADNCLLEGNTAMKNGGDGIDIGSTNNILIKNVSDDFKVIAGNHYEVVNNPGAALPTNPWINIEVPKE